MGIIVPNLPIYRDDLSGTVLAGTEKMGYPSACAREVAEPRNSSPIW
jgi:hypothetical protein